MANEDNADISDSADNEDKPDILRNNNVEILGGSHDIPDALTKFLESTNGLN